MKNILYPLLRLLAFTLPIAPAFAQGDPTPTPSVGPFWGCRNPNKWQVEKHTYFGTGPEIAEKLGSLPAHLKGRRAFLELTQRTYGGTAVVKFYEGQKDGTYSVWTWETKKASEVITKIDSTIMKNKGELCIGEECQKEFKEELKKAKRTDSISIPDSPADAFKDSLGGDAWSFICEVIWLLC